MATLFTGPDLGTYLEQRVERAIDWVAGLRDQNITEDAPGVAQEAINRWLPTQIVLDDGSVKSTAPEEKRDRHGAYWEIRLTVPYEGGADVMFARKPSTWSTGGLPEGFATNSTVLLTVQSPRMTAEELNERAHATLDILRKYVEWINADLARFRPVAEQRVRTAVDARSKSIKARRDAGGKLDFPIG